jgi:hypothetical protein
MRPPPLRVLNRPPAWRTPPYGRGPNFLEPDELLGSLAAERNRWVIYDIEHDCYVGDVEGLMQAATEEIARAAAEIFAKMYSLPPKLFVAVFLPWSEGN